MHPCSLGCLSRNIVIKLCYGQILSRNTCLLQFLAPYHNSVAVASPSLSTDGSRKDDRAYRRCYRHDPGVSSFSWTSEHHCAEKDNSLPWAPDFSLNLTPGRACRSDRVSWGSLLHLHQPSRCASSAARRNTTLLQGHRRTRPWLPGPARAADIPLPLFGLLFSSFTAISTTKQTAPGP